MDKLTNAHHVSKVIPRVGRPRTIQTPEEFDMLVDCYMLQCITDQKLPTLGEMILFMGFSHRQSFTDYATREGFEEFADSVKRARFIVESAYERSVAHGGGAGPIFLLKSVYGYQDKPEVNLNATGDINIHLSETDEQL